MPYYILRYERELEEIDGQEERLAEVVAEYRDIYGRLKALEEKEFIDRDYLHNLLTLTERLVDIVARRAQNLRREVNRMGGRVLELESERIRAEGEAKGQAQGEARIVENMIRRGMKDEDILALTECSQKTVDEIRAKVARES